MSSPPIRHRLRRRARLVARRFRPSFRRDLEDPNAPLSMDLESDSSTLLIAFGGMAGELGMPPFEFFKATGGIPVKRLFVRDLHQAWYHRGIPGHGDGIEQVAEDLGALVARHGVERLVVAGNSAGGYAALLFGTLLGADTALCFAPQTVLDLDVLAEMDDHRWDDQLRALASAGALRRSTQRSSRARAPAGRTMRSTSTSPSGSTACTPSVWPAWRAFGCTASTGANTTSRMPCANPGSPSVSFRARS